MPDRCLLYYITDRVAFAADEPTRRRRLLGKISEAALAGVDYIQLRERDLPSRDLESLAREAASAIEKLRNKNGEPATALLINSRTDVALAAHAAGVHLRSDDLSPDDVRTIWRRSHASSVSQLESSRPVIAVSCHSPEEVMNAASRGASFAVFAPVFEKKDAPQAQSQGLSRLQEACKAPISVLALGGITVSNAQSCLAAGASGVAAIRLFQEYDIATVVSKLR